MAVVHGVIVKPMKDKISSAVEHTFKCYQQPAEINKTPITAGISRWVRDYLTS